MASQFGCAHCFGEDPQAALAHSRTGMDLVARLVDGTHFGVSLRRCQQCQQIFVSIFTEFIDWSGGNDDQYADLVPITPQEAQTVQAQGERVDLELLGQLGSGRRRLATSWPRWARSKAINWESGIFLVRPGH
jgi:hypothetical protein